MNNYDGYSNPNPNPNPSYNPNVTDYSYSYKTGKKGMRPWMVVLLVVALLLIAVFGMMAVVNLFSSSPTVSSNTFVSPGQPYLAQMTVAGEISGSSSIYASSDNAYHHSWTLRMIEELINDNNNVGLILFVNTPGGGVYESDELYLKIQKYKEETGNPVYVYMGNMAASGGYYISAPADKIFANRNTWTGSIGVIVGTLIDVSGFLETHGIKAEDITSGPNKSMGSNFAPLTDEQREIFQSMVDESYNQFVEIVAEGRGMSVEEVKKIADGRIMTSAQAKDAGLIDEIMQREEFEEAVKNEISNPDIMIKDIRFIGQTSFFNSFMGLIGIGELPEYYSGEKKIDSGTAYSGEDASVAQILEMAKESNEVPIKYLYK